MKKLTFIFLAALTLLVLAGCGRNSKGTSAAAALDSDFFNQKIEGEITIAAYDTMIYRSYLEEAARAFELKYQGTKVTIDTFSAMPEVRSMEQANMRATMVQGQDDPQGRADYLSRVNTNLMSGTGADIYAIDVLPVHKFSKNGTLENLDRYMQNDPLFNKSEYRGNIIDALRYNNGTWFLPMDYAFNYFAYDATLVPAQIAAGFGADQSYSTEELLNLGMPIYTGTYRLFNAMDYVRGPGGMFNQLLAERLQSFINLETERAAFSDGRFASLLGSVRSYAEQGYIPRSVTGLQTAGMARQQGMSAPTDRFFFKQNSNVSLMSQYTRGMGMMMRMMSSGTASGIETDDEIAGIAANSDGSVPFKYNQGFGINSQSKNKAAAWAFIKFLLSKEMQLSTNLVATGLPLNNEARQEKAELTFSGAGIGGSSRMNDQMRAALEAYKTAVEVLSDQINCFNVQDTSLNDMIAQEVQYFFNGSRTADEVAKVLQNKADLYLSE